MPIDFGFGTSSNNNDVDSTVKNEQQSIDENGNEEKITDLSKENEDGSNNNSNEVNNESSEEKNIEFAIEPGTTIEFDGNTYTVNDNGDIVDSEGNIFKEAKDVKDWKDSLAVDDDTNTSIVDINSIQDAVGIDVTDENGNIIEFENTPEGVSAYVNQVIANSRSEVQQEAINALFDKYPVVADVLNYYIANGNSLEGFNQTSDRSNISVEESNVEQQESIIRTAWKEQGRRGDVEGYIDYLKSSGTLFNVAKEELAGLQQSDKELREAQAAEAKRIEEEQLENTRNHWNKVHNIIKSKTLGDYQIPNTIVRNVEGKKIGASLDDFFNYIYRVDNEGKSAYVHDLEKESDESRLTDEILRAYLKFTGGNYNSLVNMELNKKEVNRLKLISKENKGKGIKVIPPKQAKSSKLDFGI